MYSLVLHKSLNPEKWSKFTIDRQVLMIGNEVNRLKQIIENDQSRESYKECVERALELADLTICCNGGSFRKELLRWREMFGEFYILDCRDMGKSALDLLNMFYSTLLLLTPKSALVL